VFLESTASVVGLAFTQSLGLIGKAQTGMKAWGKLNAYTVSVERILEYAELTPEADDGQLVPAETWPQEGNVEFKSVALRYSPEKPMVLNKICFNVKHGKKLGIVGRTGAGKTSLISALFRLFHFEGTILIDGIDTKILIPPNSSLENLHHSSRSSFVFWIVAQESRPVWAIPRLSNLASCGRGPDEKFDR
jgi:ATP-binding cassette subfamily C (CFTR/MRP) protein 4